MSEETIQGEHRKPLFQRLRDICGCLTTEDDCDEIARVVFESYPINEKMSEEINWQERYNHLVESLPKNKRPFSDKQAQKVIASQVKRITQLEDDLSRANCQLDKLRKQNAWHGVNTESFVDGVRTGELDLRKETK